MKRILTLAGAAFAVFAMAQVAAAQDYVLRLHQFLPPQATIPAKALKPWGDKVEADSSRRIKIEYYPSMQLGGAPPALFDQAREGVVDLIWTVLGYTPGRFPVSEAFELPFMVTTAEATSRAFHEFVEKNAMDEFKEVKPIVFHTHGPGLLHVRGKGVHKLEDMQGLKLRGPTRVITALLSEMGATAIGMPVPAVPEALSKGVIDGVAIPWEVTLPLKIAELTDVHTDFSGSHGLYTATFVFAMNLDSYNKLPDDLKKVIDDNSGPEVAALFGAAMDEDDKVGLAVAVKANDEIVMLDETEKARWVAASQPVIDTWIGQMNEKGRDGAGLVAEAQALIAKYSTE